MVAVIIIGVLGRRSVRVQAASAELVAHTLQVRSRSEALLAALTDAETGQRGYLLTGDESYLEPYRNGRAEAPALLVTLRALTADSLVQQERLTALQPVMEEKLAELQRTVELARQGKSVEALAIVRTDQGKAAMDRIRTIVASLQKTEQELLAARTADWEYQTATSFSVLVGGSTLLMVLMLAALLMTARDFKAHNLQSWLKSGQSELAAAMEGNQSLGGLLDNVLRLLARYLDAHVGASYEVEPDGMLRRAAGYALNAEAAARERLAPGEGLVGQAVAERRRVEAAHLPAGYLKVSSAVGEHAPLHVVVAPVYSDERVNGVVELGLLHPLRAHERELLDLVAPQIGLALRSAQDRERLAALLEETQRQAEELQAQQEELRVSNEELEEQSQALKESQVRLENQQAELEQSNSQLEEQASALEQQKDALQRAQNAIVQKATDLERASTYKSEFLANMSHELRTPLNSSLILAKLLADNKQGNLTAEQAHFAETIHSAGTDLLALINDILDLSKIEAGKAEVHPAPIALARLVEPLQRGFAPLADEKKLSFTITIDYDAPPTIETDPQRIQQILKNLLSNAIKFTDSGTVALRISASDGDRIAFQVRDSGIGIDPGQQELIFEPFRQADSGTTRRHGGTGLGLSISRDLARLLGGEVTVASAPGSGSVFTLVLPRQWVAKSASPSSSLSPAPPTATLAVPLAPIGAPPSGGKRGRTLLIIEDDPTFAKVVADLGAEHGYQIVTAASADDGVALARKHLPAAIVLDIGLPDHSGLMVLDQLKRNSATRHLPVHVISGHDYIKTALEMGAVGYMLKPVKREQLAEALERVESRAAQAVKRVLVVEDDLAQREAVARLLGSEGVEITGAASASEALTRLGQSTFDCMVMDLKLPDQSGFEMLERLASEDAYSFPPVIIYTGRELTRDEEQRLRRYSQSIIIKDARSPERLLDEVTLFLHQVESQLSPERQRMLKAARSREAVFDGKRILVVEDDVRNIFALSRVLEPKGAKIEIARNGREALSSLERLPRVDLVLMDIMMPEMDGYQATREIRNQPKWSRLPIIALTAKAMKDDQEKCLQAGANDYIAKPLDVDRLLSLARVWMSR